MSISYQALLGETAINADSIVVQDLVAEKGIIANLDVTKNLYVEGETEMNDVIINHKLSIPTGAADGSILTSDAKGIATWKPNVHDGDITGTASATVQHHKWIGKWSSSTNYKRFNRVTFNHTEYRALSDNIGVEPVPDALQKGHSMYNDNYPPPPVPTLMYPNPEWHSRIGFNLRPHNHGKLTHFRFFKVPESTQTSITLQVITHKGERRHNHLYPVSEGTGWKEIELTEPVPLDPTTGNVVFYESEGQPFYYDFPFPSTYFRADPDVVIWNTLAGKILYWIFPIMQRAPYDPDSPPNYQGAPSYFMDFIFKEDPIWEVVLDARPDTVYEDKVQAITNKTNIETLNATVRDNLSLPNIGELAFNVYNLKYLVGTDDNKAKWITDLAAPKILARESFTLTPWAAPGRVLVCRDSSGLAEWDEIEQVEAVAMYGDVTGASNNNQVDFVGGGIPVSELLTLSKLPNLAGDAVGSFVDNSIWTLGAGTIDVNNLVTKASLPSLLPPLPDLGGDVVGAYLDNEIWTLGNGTIDVNKLVTEAKLPSLLPALPALAGDVTGTLSDNKVMSLGGGTINVADLVTKATLPGLIPPLPVLAGDVTGTLSASKVLTLGAGTIPVNTLVTKTSTDTLMNKTINHVSNHVAASIIRYSNLWTAPFGGAAPVTGQTLSFNGTNIVWGAPAIPIVTLAGDVTGASNNTVAVKARGDFTVGRIHRLPNAVQIKKLCILDYGVPDNVNDHNFQGLGTSNLMMRYHVNDLTNDHVFFAATSAAASNELFRIAGNGNVTAAGKIATSNGARIKKIVAQDNGDVNNAADHRFCGLGISNDHMRYHVSTTDQHHIFYAATSATTSKELFRIGWNGISRASGHFTTAGYIAADGDMYVGGKLEVIGNVSADSITISKNVSADSITIRGNNRLRAGTLHADWWGKPTPQGAHMGWNPDNGSGRTYFANNQGGGYGGWAWVNYNNAGDPEPSGAPAMQLSREGGLIVRGTLDFVPHYLELTGNWGGGFYTSGSISIWKSGQTITLGFPYCNANAANANPATFSTVLPVWARPNSKLVTASTDYMGIMLVKVNGNTPVHGYVLIDWSGYVLVKPAAAGFTGACGWFPTSITYPCN